MNELEEKGGVKEWITGRRMRMDERERECEIVMERRREKGV